MPILQVPEGYEVITEHRIIKGDNEGMIEASHVAYRTGAIVPVHFVADTKVFCERANCQSTGPHGRLEYWFKGFATAVEWTPKDKVTLFCQGFREDRTYACPPFFVENYNYRAGKGKLYELRRIEEYEMLFKKGLPPKASLRSGSLTVSFREDIPIALLGAVVEYNGFNFEVFEKGEQDQAVPITCPIAVHNWRGHHKYIYADVTRKRFRNVPEDLEVVKAGTRVLVRVNNP